MSQNHSPQSDRKYWAFISYSHSDTKETAWLHKALENYKVPGYLIGTETRAGVVPRRIFPVFRDRDELPTSSDLGGNLHAALRNSRYLVVVCSPRSAKSIWVDAEVNYFKKHHGGGNVLCLVVDGVPGGDEDSECFCPSLRVKIGPEGELTDEAVEPIAADMREGKDGRRRAFLKIAAGILGVDFDSLYQRDKKRRRNRLIAFSTAALLGLAMLAVFYSRLDKVAKSQSEMASQVQKMQETKFREFGSLPKERAEAIQKIFDKSGLRAFKTEWESFILNDQKRFAEYEERVDKPYIQKLENYKELKKQTVAKLEQFLLKIQPQQGWEHAKTILEKLPENERLGYSEMVRNLRMLNQLETQHKNDLAYIQRESTPDVFKKSTIELKEKFMVNQRSMYAKYLDELNIWDSAAEISIKSSELTSEMRELSKNLMQLLDAFPTEHLSREGWDQEYSKLGDVEIGTDQLNNFLRDYDQLQSDNSIFEMLKENANDFFDRGPGMSSEFYDKKFEIFAKMRDSDDVKKLNPEEKVVYKEMELLLEKEVNLSDFADSEHEKLLQQCLTKKQILIDESLKALGLSGHVDDQQTEESEKQFIENVWRLENRNKSQISLELYCLSEFVYFKLNEEGSSELDLEKIRIANQLANLAAKALWVNLK